MINHLKNLVFSVLGALIVLCTGCSSDQTNCWKTFDNNGVKLYVPISDTSKHFFWEGEIFDSIAHGKGHLKIVENNSTIYDGDTTFYYGTYNPNLIVYVSENEKYVGNTEDERFEGFGVYDKGEDLYVGTFEDGLPNKYLKWYKKGKLYYCGNWENGKFNGEGTLYKEDGTIRKGDWIKGELNQTFVDKQVAEGHYKGFVKDNKPEGYGKMSYANGDTYLGSWDNGFWSGPGIYCNNSDSVYGNWEKGSINGNVRFKSKELIFEGKCIDNKPNGIGILIASNGTLYSGNWTDGARNGLGDAIFSNGDSYYGEWKENMVNGFGTYKFKNIGGVYYGQWEDGVQDGYGVYQCPDFSYKGDWINGVMEGDGVIEFNNGDIYEGSIRKNMLDGVGTYLFSNGNRYEGQFLGGSISGIGIMQFKDGSRYEGYFHEGKIHGDGTLYINKDHNRISVTGFWEESNKLPKNVSIVFPNGDLYEGPLINGKPSENGKWYSGEEIQAKNNKINNTYAHKANDFYKKHKEDIEWVLLSLDLLSIGPAHIVVAAVSISLPVVSAGIDLSEAHEMGRDISEQLYNLKKSLIIATGCVVIKSSGTIKNTITKVFGKTVKNKKIPYEYGLKQASLNAFKQTKIIFMNQMYGKSVKIGVIEHSDHKELTISYIENENINKVSISAERILKFSNEKIKTRSAILYLTNTNKDLADNLKLSKVDHNNLLNNMLLCNFFSTGESESFVTDNIIPDQIISSAPHTEEGELAKKIWEKYFSSTEHPCNGIWVPKFSQQINNKEEFVSKTIVNTYNQYKKQNLDNDNMREILCSTIEPLKYEILRKSNNPSIYSLKDINDKINRNIKPL